MEVPEVLKIAVPLIAVPAAGVFLFRHHFAGHNHAARLLTFKHLDECLTELDKIHQAPSLKIDSAWTLYQNLAHCAQSIEYSMSGYPQLKSKIFQKTVGRMVFNQFESQGYMRHNRNEPLPGAKPIESDGDTQEAYQRLKKAIIDFENFNQGLNPHFAYGNLTKNQYAQAHCMHLADHFAMITYP